MIDDVIGIIGVSGRSVVIDEAGQTEPRAEFDQHRLERPDVAVGLDDGMAYGVARPVGMADRPVEQADAIVAFEIGRVGQHEIGERHRL